MPHRTSLYGTLNIVIRVVIPNHYRCLGLLGRKIQIEPHSNRLSTALNVTGLYGVLLLHLNEVSIQITTEIDVFLVKIADRTTFRYHIERHRALRGVCVAFECGSIQILL